MSTADDIDDDLVPVPGQVAAVNPFREAPLGVRVSAAVAMLALGACLLLVNLGAYGLWADEADTVLFAQGVWQTGDTSALLGHNVVARHNGEHLRDLHNRDTPPLSYFLLAPVVGRWGANLFAVRAPFAAAGLLLVVLAAVWLWRSRANQAQWLALLAAGIGNVSFFLFSRQCRYYAVAMLLTAVIAYLYLHHRGRWTTLVLLMIALLALLATHYLGFWALSLALAADYALWQRHTSPWTVRQAGVLFVPLTLAGVLLWWFWSGGIDWRNNGLVDRLVLWWWNLRELHACECVNLLLLVAAPLLWLVTRDAWLLRLAATLVVYTLTVALFSSQLVSRSQVAEVGVLVPMIPLAIAFTARWLYWLVIYAQWKSLPVVALTTWTNALFLLASLAAAPPSSWHGLATEIGRSFRATPWEFIREIAAPRETASQVVSAWVREHVEAVQTVWVVPPDEMYPLMAQAPNAVYAWQLDDGDATAGQFHELPKVHWHRRQAVDYIISYGPFAADKKFMDAMMALRDEGREYRHIATLDIFWDDAIRPELFWHRFHALKHFDRSTQAIQIYQWQQP